MTATTKNTFESLLAAIYEAPLQETPWRDCLRELRVAFKANNAILMLRHPDRSSRGVILQESDTGTQDRQQENPYADRLYAADPFVNLPDNQVVSLDEFVDMDALQDSEFYRLCLEGVDIFHILGVDLRSGSQLDASLRLTRGKSARRFSKAERALLAQLVPHILRGLRLHSRIDQMATEKALYSDAVSRFSVATLLLDARQRLVSANPAGDKLLQQKDGLRLQGDQLVIERRGDGTRLREIIEQAIAARHAGDSVFTLAMPMPRPSGKPAYGLIVRPLPATMHADSETDPVIALFISDPAGELETPQTALSQLFGLTPAESKLALQLANGLSLDEAVASLFISRNTGRAHLRSIFAKTGVSQQAQLVRLILKSVASLS